MQITIVHNHEYFTKEIKYFIDMINKGIIEINTTYSECEPGHSLSEPTNEFIMMVASDVQSKLDRLTSSVFVELDLNKGLEDKSYCHLLEQLQDEIKDVSDQLFKFIHYNILSGIRKPYDQLSFMNMVIEVAKENNISCSISTDAGSFQIGSFQVGK